MHEDAGGGLGTKIKGGGVAMSVLHTSSARLASSCDGSDLLCNSAGQARDGINVVGENILALG